MDKSDVNKLNMKLFWPSLLFAVVLMATFVTLDTTGVTRGMSDGMGAALMTTVALVFTVGLHRCQSKRRLDMSDLRKSAWLLLIGGVVVIAFLIVSRSASMQRLVDLQGAEFIMIFGVSVAVFAVVRWA